MLYGTSLGRDKKFMNGLGHVTKTAPIHMGKNNFSIIKIPMILKLGDSRSYKVCLNDGSTLTLINLPVICFLCVRPRYQVSVYRTIGHLGLYCLFCRWR